MRARSLVDSQVHTKIMIMLSPLIQNMKKITVLKFT
jgi:hypothetical protein